MSEIRDDAFRSEALAVLDAVEIAIAGFHEIFLEVASGISLQPQRAAHLAAQCAELMTSIADTRNVIRLSAPTEGVQ
jgi:hypothetical protein